MVQWILDASKKAFEMLLKNQLCFILKNRITITNTLTCCQSLKLKNILVIGSPRSGTTAIANLLSSAVNCAPPLPECSYISKLLGVYHEIVEYSDKPRFDAYAISRNNLKENFKLLIEKLIENVSSQVLMKPNDFIVFKDPMLTVYIDFIHDFFEPQTKIVWVLRHPLGIIASQMVVAKKQNPHTFKYDREVLFKKIVSDALNDFYIVMNSKSFKSKDFHIARYDNLINQEDTEIKNLEKFTTLKLQNNELKVNPFCMDKNDATYTDNYNMRLFKTKPSFILNKNEVQQILESFAGIMEKLEIKTDTHHKIQFNKKPYKWSPGFVLIKSKVKKILNKFI